MYMCPTQCTRMQYAEFWGFPPFHDVRGCLKSRLACSENIAKDVCGGMTAQSGASDMVAWWVPASLLLRCVHAAQIFFVSHSCSEACLQHCTM